jgi:hypothetical protein
VHSAHRKAISTQETTQSIRNENEDMFHASNETRIRDSSLREVQDCTSIGLRGCLLVMLGLSNKGGLYRFYISIITTIK